MEIHKPKPVHSWRELLTEIGVVVIGVCIALGAEQAVEWVHWREQVKEAREVVASEMARNISYGIQRIRMAHCQAQRLQDLGNILNAAAVRGSLPPVASAGTAGQSPWSTGAWESVVASQAASHFSRGQLAALSLVYRRVERIETWNRQEMEAWSVIQGMAGPDRKLASTEEAELRKAINLALYLNSVIAISSGRMIRQVMSEDLPFTSEDRQQMAAAMKYQRADGTCGPIINAPPKDSFPSRIGGSNLSELNQLQKDLPAFVATPQK